MRGGGSWPMRASAPAVRAGGRFSRRAARHDRRADIDQSAAPLHPNNGARERDGQSYLVYDYDGVNDPSGAQSGIETR
jgi:hypothetical protein